MDEPERTQQMCRAGRAQVESQHSLDCMLDQLHEIYVRHLSPLAAEPLQDSTCMTAVTALQV